jgi:hypothetical protein
MAKEVTLNGQRLTCVDSLPIGVYLDLAEGFRQNYTVACAVFLKAIVIKEDQERLREIMYDAENVCPWDEITGEASRVLPEYSNRPTERPSESAIGSEPTGGSSRVVSFSQGTVVETPSLNSGLSAES